MVLVLGAISSTMPKRLVPSVEKEVLPISDMRGTVMGTFWSA